MYLPKTEQFKRRKLGFWENTVTEVFIGCLPNMEADAEIQWEQGNKTEAKRPYQQAKGGMEQSQEH